MATPAWKHSIGMKFLSKLDVLLGYGDLGINDLIIDKTIFNSIWDQDRINWRKNNPFNKVFVHNEKKIKFTSPSVFKFLNVFSYLENKNYAFNFEQIKRNFIFPNLFIGLAPQHKTNNF